MGAPSDDSGRVGWPLRDSTPNSNLNSPSGTALLIVGARQNSMSAAYHADPSGAGASRSVGPNACTVIRLLRGVRVDVPSGRISASTEAPADAAVDLGDDGLGTASAIGVALASADGDAAGAVQPAIPAARATA